MPVCFWDGLFLLEIVSSLWVLQRRRCRSGRLGVMDDWMFGKRQARLTERGGGLVVSKSGPSNPRRNFEYARCCGRLRFRGRKGMPANLLGIQTEDYVNQTLANPRPVGVASGDAARADLGSVPGARSTGRGQPAPCAGVLPRLAPAALRRSFLYAAAPERRSPAAA